LLNPEKQEYLTTVFDLNDREVVNYTSISHFSHMEGLENAVFLVTPNESVYLCKTRPFGLKLDDVKDYKLAIWNQ